MTIKIVRNLRRISQVVFFGIFFWLILKTSFDVSFAPSDVDAIRLPYPVSIALQFDPLTALTTLLANGTLYKGLLWSLVILIPTIFLGRFFCGWICPMGSLNHWISEIRSERRGHRGKGKIDSNRYHWYQRIKYYILLFFIGAAAAGTLQVGLLDPLLVFARSTGTVVLPTIHTAALGSLGWFKSMGLPPISNAAQFVYDGMAATILPFRPMHFHGIATLAVFFLTILLTNRWLTRFWCRGLCPLGALLGIFSKYAIFGLKKDLSSCDHCDLCLEHCQGADNPEVGKRWRQVECHLCLNCQASCPNSSLQFVFFPTQSESKENPPGTSCTDITRRKTIASLVAGVALLPVLRSGDAFGINFNSKLIRPPGSVVEDDFLARCIRCGQCMRVCPNNALHPTLLQSGVEGIWTPILIPRIGYCEPSCTMCGQVCPTGAIYELTHAQKVGGPDTKANCIGTAFIDPGRCLPHSMGTPCIVCEEWCPTSPKAIYLKETVVTNRQGERITVRQPFIDPAICTGCGACEFACPVVDQPAIYVTSVGESRSTDNQILLERTSGSEQSSTTTSTTNGN